METLEVLEKVLRGKRIKTATQRHYRESLRSLSSYEAEWPINGIVISEWLASLKGYSDSTIKMWFDFVNSAGKYMEKAYGIENPCKTADRPKVSKKRRRYYTVDELVKIIRTCKYDYDKALVLTLVDSTCRIGEIGANRQGEGGLYGRDVGDTWIHVAGKTGERRYRLDAAISVKLKQMAGGDNEPVFKDRFGRASSVDALQHRVRRVVKAAGIGGSKLGPHTLRHSGASLVAIATKSALAVKALLQHDNIETSMGYIHDAEDVIQQEVSPLALIRERVFGGGDFIGVKEQLQIGMGEDVVEGGVASLVPVGDAVEGEVVEAKSDYFDEIFPEIKDGVEVRSIFKTDDLRLIRDVFADYCRSGLAGSKEVKLRYLLKRMLRRVKM